MTRLAIVQMQMSANIEENEAKAMSKIDQAADSGAQIVLLPELFSDLYFPQNQLEENFSKALGLSQWGFFQKLQEKAKARSIVLPVSFFEKAGEAYFNSLAVIDADGRNLGIYRKTHIPDGPGYTEKYYFSPGDTGFKVFDTAYGKLGCGICWDQWFPEAARVMTLKGADVLLYPTAIGSEPIEAHSLDTSGMWQKAMIGHCVSNAIYVAAANRIGKEDGCDFYGNSFIANYQGEFLQHAGEGEEKIILADLDFIKQRSFRAGMGFFRDRRPEHYGAILSLDGNK